MSKNISTSRGAHEILKDSDIHSKIFRLHDISHFQLTNRMVTWTRPKLIAEISECRNEQEAMFLFLMECFNNPIFACRWLLGVDLLPFQAAILYTMWNHRFVYLLASRGSGKSFSYAIYALLRCLLVPNCRVVIVSGSFRQSRFVFDYIRQIYENWPILRQIARPEEPKIGIDHCRFKIGSSNIVAIPIGSSQFIRGFRSTVTLVDEFQILDEEVFKVVVWGFSAVSQTPNERVRRMSRKDSRWIGYTRVDKNETTEIGNQVILCGTASFEFNHAYKWYCNYQNIIKTRGKKEHIRRLVGDELSDRELEAFNWKDFAVITLPHELLPAGFLDESIVVNAKINMPQEFFDMEYNCIWVSDTTGFIPMSLIKSHTEGEVENGSLSPCVMGVGW